jgi:hypothetical protein
MRRLSNAAAQFGAGRQLSFCQTRTAEAEALNACGPSDALSGRSGVSIGTFWAVNWMSGAPKRASPNGGFVGVLAGAGLSTFALAHLPHRMTRARPRSPRRRRARKDMAPAGIAHENVSLSPAASRSGRIDYSKRSTKTGRSLARMCNCHNFSPLTA